MLWFQIKSRLIKNWKYEKRDGKGYSNIDERMMYGRYYNRNIQSSFDMNCASKFTDPLFWQRVHEHLTSHEIYNNIKYKLYQVVFPVNTSSFMDTIDWMKIIKESRFSNIRPIDGVTRLKLYNCSNIIGLGNGVHNGGQIVVEIPKWLFDIIYRRYFSCRS